MSKKRRCRYCAARALRFSPCHDLIACMRCGVVEDGSQRRIDPRNWGGKEARKRRRQFERRLRKQVRLLHRRIIWLEQWLSLKSGCAK